jgi:phage baseplate assembly protein W
MTPDLKGFQIPFRIVGGGVAQASGSLKMEQNLMHLIATRVGERIMLRTYGGGVHSHVQDNNSGALRALVRREIETALRQFLPDARLTAPLAVTSDEGQLTVTITYRGDPLDIVRRLEVQL